MSERTEFLQYLSSRVDHYEKQYSVSRGKAFTIWYGVDQLGMDDDAAFEASLADGGMDKGIDFLYIDEEHRRAILLSGKYRKNGDYSPKVGELYELQHALDWISEPETLRREGRTDLAAMAEDFCDAIEQGYSAELVFAYTGPSKKELQDAQNKFNAPTGAVAQGPVCKVHALDSLVAAHRERIGSTRIPKADLYLKSEQWFRSAGAFGTSLVATMPGRELRHLYLEHGEPLFDRNVRLFLGARQGGVNAGMRDTLQSPTQRKNFWAYNNGITVVCERFDLDESTGQLTLWNFSIVNGCQTTTSLGRATETAASDVELIARVIQASDTVIDDVIRYNNSQTPVRIWEFSSQDPLQRKLKDQLAEDPSPYLYVLRKGETRSLSEADRDRFRRDGSLQQIPHDQLTQYLAAFEGMPTVAYKDKARLFETLRGKIYPDDLPVAKVILVWRLGQTAEQVVREEIRKASEDEDSERLRILRQGGRIFVVAVAGEIIRLRNSSVFAKRLKRDVAVSKKTGDRLEQYVRLGMAWYVQAAMDVMQAGSDLNQIVRSEDAYGRVAQKVRTQWDTFSLSKAWLDDALPKF